jgi:replicative DNA helicase
LNTATKTREPTEAEAAHAASNVEAEQALLGALLFQNQAFDRLNDPLSPEDFYEPFHQRLYAAIESAIRSGKLAEPITLHKQFEADPGFVELGGLSYLSMLVDRAPPAENAKDYASAVRDASLRRGVLFIGGEMRAGIMEGVEPLDVIAHAGRSLSDLEVGASGDHWTPAGEAIRTAIQNARTRTGRIDFPTGDANLDEFTGGLKAGEMTLLAARPGMGKSVAGLTIARACASQGLGVCVFSLEMTTDALALRLACDLAYDRSAPVYSGEPTCPTFNRAMKGELDPGQWAQLDRAQAEVDRWALHIDDRAGLTMPQIEAAARRQHREWAARGIKPGPVIIDHLGKVKPSNNRKGDRRLEVADVSGDGQVMAKRLGVPLVGLVQLNRGVEGRDDKRPMLSDLRQAGELEEDARQVIFIYRPEYYVREAKPDETYDERIARLEKLDACRNQLFWLVEKNSHGPRGQVQSFCEIACSAIREW